MEISLRFLGSLRVLIDGVHVPVERAQTRAFLALLARHPGTAIPASTVIDLLWNGDMPRQPMESLRTVATRARKALGADHLLRSIGSGYLLDLPPSSIDFLAFRDASDTASSTEDLRAALSLWNGVPFSDCGHNRRLQLLAEELEDCRWTLAERYIRMLLREDQADVAVSFGVPLLDERPGDERVAALIAIGLARTGEERAARSLIARAREVAGATASSVLDEAEARIATELPAPSELRPEASSSPLSGHVVELVGREMEIDQLRSAAIASRSKGQLVILIGDPGVGKTALAASFAQQLGWNNWAIRCGGPSTEFVDMSSTLLATHPTGAAEAAATLAPTVAQELRQFASSGPAVLVCDDLQAASEVELLIVRSIVRTGLPPDALVVATLRPLGGLTGHVSRIIADVTREPNVTIVDLGGLSPAAVRELARRIRPGLSTRACSRLHELTRGNAFAVRSLCELGSFDVDQPISDLPAALVQMTGQRVDSLDQSTRDALELASLLDPPIDFGAVAALRGTDRVTLLESLRPAFDGRVLVEDRSGEVRFDHELTRQAVQQRTPPALRRALHDRLARHFDERGDVILSGHHLACAMPDSEHPRAAPRLLHAAEAALVSQRYRVAVECFEAAEGLLDPASARRTALRRGFALEQSGRRAAAAELYDAIADDSLAADDREALASAALAGLTQGVVGGDRRRMSRLGQSLDHPPDDPRLQLELLVQLAAEHTAGGNPPAPEVRHRAAVLADDHPADQSLLAFLDVLGVPFSPIGPDSFERIDRLEALATAGGDAALILRAMEQRCSAAIAVQDVALLRRSLVRLEHRLRSHPSPRQRWAAAMFRSMVADLEGGGLQAAAPLARAALDLGRDLDLPDAANAYAIFRLSIAVRTGGLDVLEPLVRAAASGDRSVPTWHAVHATSLRDGGRPEEAIGAVERFRVGVDEGRSVFAEVGYAVSIAALVGLTDERATDLRDWAVTRLTPWSGRLLVLGAGAGCFGPADLYLVAGAAATPAVTESWAGAWSDGPWSDLAAQVGRFASR